MAAHNSSSSAASSTAIPADYLGLAARYAFRDYPEARASFLSMAAGGRLERFPHPLSPRADGAEFGVDAAWFGPQDARKALLMISGTHGPELFSGSAMQRLWMQLYAEDPRCRDVGVLLVHAMNPYGCAHGSRTTEDNVDLNRNFISFPASAAHSKVIDRVQDALALSTGRGPRLTAAHLRLLWLALRHGRQNVVNAVTAGQHQRADGVGYGGVSPQWSHTTLTDLLNRHLARAEKVAVIDWHTGIGEYGEPFFLCFDAPGTLAFERALNWWGDGVSRSSEGYGDDERPAYQGLLVTYVQELLHQAGAQSTAAVVEFGTFSNHKMLQALLRDRWLRSAVGQGAAEGQRRVQLEAVRHAFCPDDGAWRQSVLRRGHAVLEQTIEGLSRW